MQLKQLNESIDSYRGLQTGALLVVSVRRIAV